jgi:uncharacterized integral membrane protein
MLFRNLRYKYAFMFGRLEHNASRLLFVVLLITFYSHHIRNYKATYILLISCIILWSVYWLSHRGEKALHPDH